MNSNKAIAGKLSEESSVKEKTGVPSWVVLTAADANAAANFYEKLFGWNKPEEATLNSGVRILNEIPVAGINQHAGALQPKWRIHIDVADLHKTAETILKAGGKIVQTSSGTEGNERYTVVADPFGVEFVVHEGRKQDASPLTGQGTFVWSELISDDVQASLEFYNQVFGWTLSEPIEGDFLGRREWLLNGLPIAGLLPRPAAMPKEIPPYWDVFFAVDSPAETVKNAIELGAVNLLPPINIPHGEIAVFADPNGIVFSVVKSNH